MIAARKEDAGARRPDAVSPTAACVHRMPFPFPDGLIAAADAGVTAVIRPGSLRDDDVIAAADEGARHGPHRLRHFRH